MRATEVGWIIRGRTWGEAEQQHAEQKQYMRRLIPSSSHVALVTGNTVEVVDLAYLRLSSGASQEVSSAPALPPDIAF
ncbi:hypothetical protein BST61_g6613 [Cercospora zeina]